MSSAPFIENQKQLYKSLKPCFCSAIQAMVYFNSDGLKHLLYDKHRPRNFREKQYRIALIDYIVEAVFKAQRARQETFANPPCQLWILDWVEVKDRKGNDHSVKVILRKKGNGNVHFWSVMQKRNYRIKNHQTKSPNHKV